MAGKREVVAFLSKQEFWVGGCFFDFSPKGDPIVKAEAEETGWLRGMRKKIEEEMAKKEIESILYWKGELEKILGRRAESLGTFQVEMQNFVQRMQNRIKMLKNSLQS